MLLIEFQASETIGSAIYLHVFLWFKSRPLWGGPILHPETYIYINSVKDNQATLHTKYEISETCTSEDKQATLHTKYQISDTCSSEEDLYIYI